jgi:hypothetical protein
MQIADGVIILHERTQINCDTHEKILNVREQTSLPTPIFWDLNAGKISMNVPNCSLESIKNAMKSKTAFTFTNSALPNLEAYGLSR